MAMQQTQAALMEPPVTGVPEQQDEQVQGPQYGDTNEKLPETLQSKLKELARHVLRRGQVFTSG